MADLSIIVTAYNIEDFIEQCLDSVAVQTLRDIEVLVVDDGSSDSTPEKIVELCAGDPRFIPVLLPKNSPGGVATAANAGLDRATAPWVGFSTATTTSNRRCSSGWSMPPPDVTRIWRCASTRRSSMALESVGIRPMRTGGLS